MTESNFLVVITQLKRDILLGIKGLCMNEGVKYPCRLCGNQSTSKGDPAQHRRAVLEDVKYPFRECGYQATSKGHLARHKRAVHEGVKNSCGHCGHQSTSKGYLAQHKRAVHEGDNVVIS